MSRVEVICRESIFQFETIIKLQISKWYKVKIAYFAAFYPMLRLVDFTGGGVDTGR